MNVVGLDLSLSATGVALGDETCKLWKPKSRGVERLRWFRSQIVLVCSVDPPDLVVLEDYSYGSRLAHSHELGELGGVVRLVLADSDIPWVAVSPASLKKYATGKGNAGKEEMKAAARKRLGYTGENDNEADALWLRHMGLDAFDHAEVALPAGQRDALAKVLWPT